MTGANSPSSRRGAVPSIANKKSPSSMNWTGGRLQQSKNANKGIIQKQKAHFARARTQLQNNIGASTPAFPSGFFGAEGVTRQPQFPRSSARTARLPRRGRKLQDQDRSIAASPVRYVRPGTRDAAERRPLHGHNRANDASSGNTSSKCATLSHRSDAPGNTAC